MATGKSANAPKSFSRAPGIWTVVVIVMVIGACVAGMTRDPGLSRVPPPTAQERGDTVAILRRSTANQGICYGWTLKEFWYRQPISVGSNLGDGVEVKGRPDCPRWLQVSVELRYGYEDDNSAVVEVTGSSAIGQAALSEMELGLQHLGLDEETFVDEPSWAVTRAAVMLPLLAVEAEVVEPVAAAALPATAAPSPLPDAGSDLWRDRWKYLLAVAGLLLVAGLLITVGLTQRGRQRRGAAGPTRT